MSLQKIILVMKQEIYATLHRFFFVLFAFVIPVVLGVIAGVTYSLNRDAAPDPAPEESNASLWPHQGYVDLSGVIRVVPDEIPDDVFREFAGESGALAALEEGQIDGFFIIHPDYLEGGELVYVTPAFNPIVDDIDTGLFERVLTLNLFGDDVELGRRVLEPFQLKVTELSSESAAPSEGNWMADQLPFFLVLLLYMVILIPASSLVTSITNEKKNRVLEILLSSVSPAQFFIGKLLALGLLGVLQTLVWVATVWGVARFGGRPLNLPVDFSIPAALLVWTVLYSLTGYAMYGTQMAGIGALAPNMNDTRSLTMLVLSPLIVGYTFNIVFLEAPDSTLALVLSLFPLTAPVVMIGRLASADLPLWQPVLSLILQMAAVVWIVRLFTRLFRAQALLSGSPLTLKSLVKALRTP